MISSSLQTPITVAKLSSHPKVDEVDFVSFVWWFPENNVSGFDVTMNKAHVMKGFQRIDHLFEDVQSKVQPESAVGFESTKFEEILAENGHRDKPEVLECSRRKLKCKSLNRERMKKKESAKI